MTADSDSTPTKTCTKCRECKPATSEFFVKKLSKLTSRCKLCLRADKKIEWHAKKEAVNANRRASRQENIDAVRARDRDRYHTVKKFQKKQERKYCAEANRRYYLANREAKLEYQKEYQQKNWEAVKLRGAAYNRERRAKDTVFSVGLRVRALISISLRAKGVCKSARTEKILGCTLNEFITHIEKQFAKGMSWENRDEWHLDHILPMSSAKSESDVIALNHHTNLRPLWAADNLRKRDTVTHLI